MIKSFENVFRQEDEQAAAEAAEAAGAGEDLCHLNAYNRRLRAMQSPNERTQEFGSF